MSMSIVRIEAKDGLKAWVYTKKKNAIIGNILYFMGEKWKIVEIEN